jgi:hypothetical protein
VSAAFFIFIAMFALAASGLLYWVFRSARRNKPGKEGLGVLDSAPQHLCNMGSIRQSVDPLDLKFVLEKGGRQMAKRLRRERRRVALLYLSAIRKDFEQLLRVARVVALLSPEVSSTDEFDRLRLGALFLVRFQLVKLRFHLGWVSMPQLGALGEMVTSLALEMEASMRKLGERAVLAAELALQSEQ